MSAILNTWSRAFRIAAVTIASITACTACSTTQHASDAQLPDAGDASIRTRATDAGAGFVRIPIEGGSECGDGRQSIAIGAPPNVLVSTGCALYSVNTDTHQVVPREAHANVNVIDEDGSTVAVVGDKLGLSLDGGETFAWTDWFLIRCGGRPNLSAGGGLALVGCVAGAGSWRGDGTAFESVPVGGILPVFAAHDSQVVINGFDGWYASSDHGETFEALSVSGLPDGFRPDRIEIVGSKLFAAGVVEAGTDTAHVAFFAASLGSGTFARVTASPRVKGMVAWSYNQGTLVVMSYDASEFYFSTDSGESFTEQKLEGIVIPPMGSGPAVKYGAGQLHILTDEALYVGPLATDR